MPNSVMYIFPILAAVAAIGAGIYYMFSNTQQENPHRARSHNKSDFVDSSNNCTICLEGIRDFEAKYLPCGHSFHTRCINKWLTNSDMCPNCKTRTHRNL